MIKNKKLVLIFLCSIALSIIRCFYTEDNILNFILSFVYLSFTITGSGATIYLLFISDDKKTDTWLFWAYILTFGTVFNSFTILLLACLFKFSLSILLIINIVFTSLIFLLPQKKISFRTLRKHDYLTLFFIIIAIFLFCRPMPRINGGRDPGVYFGTAMNIAKQGTLIFTEKSIPFFPEKYYTKNLLYIYEKSNKTGMYLPGFYMTDHKHGKIAPQFFHLYSAFIALIFALLGLKPALYATCFLALLSVLMFYCLLKNIFNEKTALLSLIIFVFSTHNVWYARYLNSEIMVQLLFFSSILLFALSEKSKQYLLSGLLLGLTFFARIDSLLFVGSLMVMGLILAVRPKLLKSLGITVSAALICFLIAQLYGYYFSKIYYLSKFLDIAVQKQNTLFLLLSVFIFSCITLFVLKKKIQFILFLKTLSSVFCAVIIIIFLKTFFTDKHSPAHWFILYYSFYGVAVGLSGICMFMFNTKNQPDNKVIARFFLTASFFVWLVVLFPAPRIRPDHFWAIRRFTAVALPILTAGMGYLFATLFFRSIQRLKIIGIILYIVLIGILLRILYPTLKLSECDGLIDGLYSLKKHIKQGSAIVVFDPKIGLYGTPLYFSDLLDHYLFIPVGQNTNLMNNFEPLEKILADLIKTKDIYFFSFKPQQFPLKKLEAKPLIRTEIPIPLLEITVDRLPAKTEPIFDVQENYLYVWKLKKK